MKSMTPRDSIRLGADIGGTFTDIALECRGTMFSTKVPTNYSASEQAILDGIAIVIRDADWDASNAINVKGTYHMMVAAVRQMRGQPARNHVRGRIVNITSVDAFKAHPQNAHYAATKAAVVSLTRSFAHEVAPDGILVNSVAPAGMATERARELGFLG